VTFDAFPLPSNLRALVHGSVPFRYETTPPHDTELTCTQYALVFLPGLIAGRLCDLGYFKRTLFISRSVTRDFTQHSEHYLTTNSKLAVYFWL